MRIMKASRLKGLIKTFAVRIMRRRCPHTVCSEYREWIKWLSKAQAEGQLILTERELDWSYLDAKSIRAEIIKLVDRQIESAVREIIKDEIQKGLKAFREEMRI